MATKDELRTEADARGLDVPADATKDELQQALDRDGGGDQPAGAQTRDVDAGASPQGVAPGLVMPNDTNVRSDSDVIQGRFARVTAGEHEGRYGVVKFLGGEPDGDGFPTVAVITTRDDLTEDLEVAYGDLEPAEAGGR